MQERSFGLTGLRIKQNLNCLIGKILLDRSLFYGILYYNDRDYRE